MKQLVVTILALIAVAIPWQSSAQTNVKKAFDKLLNSTDVEMQKENHQMSKSPQTGKKESMFATYYFSLPESKEKLIKDVLAAFRADDNEAYTMQSGVAGKEDPPIHLAAGEGPEYNVRINYEGYHYIYACYLAPSSEDPSGNHRYAYGVYWKKDKGNKIDGGLVITYATTLKYRQEQDKLQRDKVLQSSAKSQDSEYDPDSWFQLFMNYVYAFDAADDDVKLPLATRIYQCAKQMPENASVEDRRLANNILSDMIESKKYSDNTIKLLNAANEIIK
ncbi:MAG: hypothetical protein ACI4AK_06500 [Lepagella sp.]